ncbi:DUF2441 domain-containing protein [uncultured Desulfobacter sp.]|uniref:DUF2441 domain-containing protein n=1 Tax=uncultured Desulfobacter sp. TaxID=240139 RepID=UPI0029F520EA|nr:hypothetical protein [uncultured Desulfobacter sp.]
MDADFFHLSPIRLKPGSIIEPGNWGRIMKAYSNTQSTNPWNLLREQTFELIRATRFPEKPSRYKSAYLFESIEIAKAFKDNERPFDVLSKVKILDMSKPIHIACMNLTMIGDGLPIIPRLEEQATQYWQGKNIQAPEVLTESDIEIVDILPG